MIILHRTRERLPSVSATALALLATTLGGCVYRMNIQQGNYLEGKTVDQLQAGMTRSQVRYLLGTPKMPAAARCKGMPSDGPAAARAAMSASRMLASGLSSTLQRYCRSRVA